MIGFKQMALGLSLLTGLGFSVKAPAALFDRGNGLVYDDVLNVTWTKDANLFKTLADDSGNPTNFAQKIIDANGGVINNTPNYWNSSGVYNLSLYDFLPQSNNSIASEGELHWWAAQAFIGYLNNTNYSGFNNWRLPSLASIQTISGNFQSELTYMYKVNLGLMDNYTTIGDYYSSFGIFGNAFGMGYAHPETVGPINNFQTRGYWLSDENVIPAYAWAVDTFNGSLGYTGKAGLPLYAWAVRDGDVAAVPAPPAIWLFASGLGLFTLNRHVKKSNS